MSDDGKTIRSYTKLMSYSHGFARWAHESTRPLVYQEKVDGSQISFRLVPGTDVVEIRSKRAPARGNDMFAKGCEVIDGLDLVPGWTYRGEYLQKPKHNTLTYGRVPVGHIALFDVDRSHCEYLTPDELRAEGERIGLEVVPTWVHEGAPDPAWLERESFLGGCTVEGWVAKDYERLDRDQKVAMVKHVRESFREVHRGDWKKRNPSKADRVMAIAERYRTEARWAKAVQHLREAGELQDAPQDIGALMREACRDIEEECADEVKEQLYAVYRKDLLRIATRGLPEWYKALLLDAELGGAA